MPKGGPQARLFHLKLQFSIENVIVTSKGFSYEKEVI
jgi:hypothetical protein